MPSIGGAENGAYSSYSLREFLDGGLAAGEIRDEEDIETLVEVVVGTWYSLFLSSVRIEAYPLRLRAAAVSRFLARTISAPM